MNDMAQRSHSQQQLYWAEIVKLKIASSYIRRYRDYLNQWVTALGTVKAVASSVSIAAWAIWRQYAFVWGFVIAIAQVADALKEVFPFTKRHKAASEHAVALDSLFIDAQLEWDNIFSGRYTDEQIMTRLHKLRKFQHDAERRSFPDGLAQRSSLFTEAQQDAQTYFASTYGVK